MTAARVSTRYSFPLSLLLSVLATEAQAQLQTRQLEQIVPGVYAVIYSEMKQDPVQSNSLIIIGDDGIAVVDAHYTPSAARETIAAIRRLSKLPVKYLITTHWHDDHIFGNQEYKAAYPGVVIVAQDHTRASMVAKAGEHRDQLVASYSRGVENVQGRLKRGTDDSGKAITAADRVKLEANLAILTPYLRDYKAVRITLPDLTFDKQLTLRLGTREIQVRSFGPGNTRGDAVIWLPQEQLVATGDLVVHPVPFIYGGFPVSWVGVLDSIRALSPRIIVPGHGPVMRDFGYIDQVDCLLRSLSSQVRAAKAQGKNLEAVPAGIDLKRVQQVLVNGDPAREETFESSILQSGVRAAFEEETTRDLQQCLISDDSGHRMTPPHAQ